MKQMHWCNKLEDTEYLVEFLPIVQFVRLRRPDRLFLDRWTTVLLPILHPPPPHPPPEAREKNERRVCVRGRRRRMKEEEEEAGEKRCEEKMRRRRGEGGRESEGKKRAALVPHTTATATKSEGRKRRQPAVQCSERQTGLPPLFPLPCFHQEEGQPSWRIHFYGLLPSSFTPSGLALTRLPTHTAAQYAKGVGFFRASKGKGGKAPPGNLASHIP